uniref:von Willebrand factor type A domain-containing protein n=1 Tax=Wuchereria bancrofti TaxID=6293 RepID=A0AAF5PPP7_WUCBA
MLPLIYGTAISLILITPTLITAINYEDNDLAKVCRPLDRQLDLLFILDGSGSVSGSTFATQMAMLNKIVDLIEIGPKNTQIAVMQYSSYTRVEFNFSANPNKESLRASLQKIRHISGTTKTGKALDKAFHVFCHDSNFGARLNQDDVAQVAVVVTDGHSHDDPIPAAMRLRQAGVQILTLGIGAHINMGELVEITGDQNLAFQNLTSQASLDQFVHQFKKIAVGEHCEFSRGVFGAEINCHSDSIEIIVSTVNPFYGHLYIPGHFHVSECAATARNSSSKEIRFSIDLTSCNIQKQTKQNLMGTLFETNVLLKFHPLYNTKADKIFKVQCFYPEKVPKLPRKYVDNRVATSNKNELKMPCSYKMVSSSKPNDKCKLEDVRVGDQIIHSWECDKDSFDTYQSMLVHTCVIIDLNSGVNRTVIDSFGCALDSSVMDSPEYVEPLSAFAVGKAVKFPDGSMIKMHCHLRFCDRLLSECDTILPPRCRRSRQAAKRSNENTKPINAPLKEMNRSWDFTGSIDSDDEYEEIVEAMTFTIATTTATTTTTILTAAPLLTFHPSRQEKLMPSRRRLTIVERVTASGSHSVRSLPLLLAPGFDNTASYPLGKLISAEETPFAVSSARTNNQPPNGYPHIIDFPTGGMDVKINTQNVAIVSDDHLKQKYQKELKEQEKIKSLTKKVPKTPVTITSSVVLDKTTISAIKFNQVIKGVKQTSQQHQSNYSISRTEDTELPALEIKKKNTIMNDSSQETGKQTTSRELVEEFVEEVQTVVQLEQRIQKMLRSDATMVESQVINVRDLEVMSDPNLKEKWCKK